MTIFIYGLVCPLAGVVRYVGKSTNPEKRLRAHLCGARRGAYHHHTARWLRSLGQQEPAIVILHEVSEGERWQDVERAFIATAADRGWRLTNSTAGGEGLDYLKPEDEARWRANWKRSMDAHFATPAGKEHIRRLSSGALKPDALQRRNQAIRSAAERPEFREKMSVVNKEIGSRPEVKAVKSAAMSSHWQRTEYRETIIAARNDPEFVTAQSERLKQRWSAPGSKMRAVHSSEETRRKKSEAAHRRATPEYRAMMAEKTRLSWEKRRKGN